MRNCFHTLSYTFIHFHTFLGYARSVIVTTRTRNTAKSPSSLPPVTSPSDAHSVKSLLPPRIFRTVSIAKVNLPSRFWLGMITKTRASPMWLLKISSYPVFCSRLSSFPLSVLPLLPGKSCLPSSHQTPFQILSFLMIIWVFVFFLEDRIVAMINFCTHDIILLTRFLYRFSFEFCSVPFFEYEKVIKLNTWWNYDPKRSSLWRDTRTFITFLLSSSKYRTSWNWFLSWLNTGCPTWVVTSDCRISVSSSSPYFFHPTPFFEIAASCPIN